ncbi:unnamed protein product [Rhizoctonia solani]|uniref:F-box domain-containing protein n=1 Tax=Rhizoctonia solani TaxID=456999 RepID=A0A8H3I3S1_9AGAM|nr:unnamed protein product [Rhizoctonia solani]
MSPNACLDDLPIEIIASILKVCDYRTVLRFSSTNTRYREIVGGSSSLQLLIELEINGLEILKKGVDSSDESLLKELRRCLLVRRSLNYLAPQAYRVAESWRPGIKIYNYMIHGDHYFGLYDELDIEDPDDLNFTSLLIVDLSRREYEEPVYLSFETRFRSFDADLTQELVVLTEARSGDPTLSRFHFCSTIDGKPHPLARHALISIQLEDPGFDELIPSPVLDIQTEISGKVLIIGYHWSDLAFGIFELLIFDWVSGALLGRIRSEAAISRAFTLLDNQHLALLSATRSNNSPHPDMVVLMIYQIPCIALPDQDEGGSFNASSYPSLAPILVLHFPPIQDSLVFRGSTTGFILRTNPGVGQAMFGGPSIFVCARVPVFEIRMSFHNFQSETHNFSYQIYISTYHIFELLARREPGQETFSWNEWGPRATRWFDYTGNRSPLMGTQCVRWIGSGSYHKLSTIEFNPRPLEGPPVQTEMFGSNVKSVFHAGFKEPVESCLPYRITCPENASTMRKCRRWDIQGHRLIGYLSRNNMLRSPAILICDSPPT